jgi:hypothetical protein
MNKPIEPAEETSTERPAFGRTIGLSLILLLGLAAAAEAFRIGVLLPGGLGIGSAGPGMFPLITSIGVVAFSVTALATSIAGSLPRLPVLRRNIPSGLVSVFYYIGALVFYALILDRIGFPAATAITVGFILRFAEGYRWISTIVITLVTVCACYVLFNVLLGAHLPAGRLWR